MTTALTESFFCAFVWLWVFLWASLYLCVKVNNSKVRLLSFRILISAFMCLPHITVILHIYTSLITSLERYYNVKRALWHQDDDEQNFLRVKFHYLLNKLGSTQCSTVQYLYAQISNLIARVSHVRVIVVFNSVTSSRNQLNYTKFQIIEPSSRLSSFC